ncbi:hypothetical protein Tco_0095587, partial [Tanacetum coccineum]
MFWSPLLLSHLLCLQQLFLHHSLLSSHICNKHQFPHQQLFQAPPCKIFPTLAPYSSLTIDIKLWKPTSLSSNKRTNLFAEAVSSILGIVDAYLANKMHEAIKTVVQLQSETLRDEAQAENADFLNKLDDNIKKIIKHQVKEQVKAQVFKILPKIKKTVNEQLEVDVMTRSSTKSK